MGEREAGECVVGRRKKAEGSGGGREPRRGRGEENFFLPSGCVGRLVGRKPCMVGWELGNPPIRKGFQT